MSRHPLTLLMLAAVGLFAMISVASQGMRPPGPNPEGSSPVLATRTSSPAASRPASAPTAQELMLRAQQAYRANQRLMGLFKAGKYDQAREMTEGMIQEDPQGDIHWYNLACAHSRLGDKKQALASLDKAVEIGYCDFIHLEGDEDLAALRQEPRYKALLARRDEFQRARAARILAGIRRQYGVGYISEIDHEIRVVLATNYGRKTFDGLKAQLTSQATGLWNDLFPHKFEQYVTVVISKTDPADMGVVGGSYKYAQHSLIAKSLGRTVTHEFTHALHAADMEARGQIHYIWIIEGLATLFESAQFEAGHIKPVHNEHLASLKGFLSSKKTVPWAEFMNFEQAKFIQRDIAAVAYSQSRYMMMYLWEKGKLKAWYEAYCDSYKDDHTGIKAMEKVFDKPLADIEKDWLLWAGDLKMPSTAPAH